MSSPTGSPENDTGVIIFGSETERVLSLLFLGPCTVYTLCAQIAVLMTIIKSPSLHNVHFYMIGVSCCVDMTIVGLSGPMFIQQFISGAPISFVLCDVVSIILSIAIVGFIAQIGLMAYERFVYFCRPFRYQRVMGVKRVAAALVTCYVTSFIVNTGSTMMYERQYHASVLVCNVNNAGVQDTLILCVVMLPSALVTVYSMVRIWRLIRAASATETLNMTTPIQQSQKTLRMILLLSGAYWGTILPGGIARIIFFQSGYTWQDVDSRRYLGPAVINRLLMFLSCSVSSALNPLIYLYTRKDLRDAAKKLLLTSPKQRTYATHASNN